MGKKPATATTTVTRTYEMLPLDPLEVHPQEGETCEEYFGCERSKTAEREEVKKKHSTATTTTYRTPYIINKEEEEEGKITRLPSRMLWQKKGRKTVSSCPYTYCVSCTTAGPDAATAAAAASATTRAKDGWRYQPNATRGITTDIGGSAEQGGGGVGVEETEVEKLENSQKHHTKTSIILFLMLVVLTLKDFA